MRSPINTRTAALKPDDAEMQDRLPLLSVLEHLQFLENNFENLWSGMQGHDEASVVAWVTQNCSMHFPSLFRHLPASWLPGLRATVCPQEQGRKGWNKQLPPVLEDAPTKPQPSGWTSVSIWVVRCVAVVRILHMACLLCKRRMVKVPCAGSS